MPSWTFINTSTGQTGTIQSWTVPSTGTYKIEVWGAQGGGTTSGLGAKISGTFSLTGGEILKIVVGQQGMQSTTQSAGGGGGSFIWKDATNGLLIAAGGGGGVYLNTEAKTAYADAVTTQDGQRGGSGTGGTNGNGGATTGTGSAGWGGGGAGWLSNGADAVNLAGTGGKTRANGFTGGTTATTAFGGFGGGGGTHGNSGGGAGGGGYSGGGGGTQTAGAGSGGGGGSYNGGTSVEAIAGTRLGHGQVTITETSGVITNNAQMSVTTATLNGTVQGYDATYTQYFEYGNTASYGTSITCGTGSGAYSANISGLSANNVYYYRAYVNNGTTTYYGAQQTFTTKTGLAICTTDGATNIAATTMTIAGTITSFDE